MQATIMIQTWTTPTDSPWAALGFWAAIWLSMLALHRLPGPPGSLLRHVLPWMGWVQDIKSLVSAGRFKEAVRLAECVRAESGSALDTHRTYLNLFHVEFDVHFALALIYVGRVNDGIALLTGITECLEGEQDGCPLSPDGRHRNWVLGRARNNLGYAYWGQGRFQHALREFRAALRCFRASWLLEEYANTCDNIGRVYVELDRSRRAKAWIGTGLILRIFIWLLSPGADTFKKSLGAMYGKRRASYRFALSLNSLAIAHLAARKPRRAERLSRWALYICTKLEVRRGIGLAHLTLARAVRQKAAIAKYTHEERVKLLERAAGHLAYVRDIFSQHVLEPMRLIEAHSELGKVHRDLADLARQGQSDPSQVRRHHHAAAEHLWFASGQAAGSHPLLYVDACIQLAQTYYQHGHLGDAKRCLQHTEQAIPDRYKITENAQWHIIPIEERIDRFWYQMGQIELLRAEIARARGGGDHSGEASCGTSTYAAEQHDALAEAYLRHDYEQAFEGRVPAFAPWLGRLRVRSGVRNRRVPTPQHM